MGNEWAAVQVSLRVNLDEAKRLGREEMARRFLETFRHQGELWQGEVKADPLLQQILRVEVFDC